MRRAKTQSVKRPGSPLLAALGGRIREARAQQGLTRRALAERSGLSERFVAELESGRGNISLLNLAEVARVLDSAPSALLEGLGVQSHRGVIALLGLRGAGKTTVGQKLARALEVPFFELDRLVEAEAGMQLSELFAMHGEDYFRRVEHAALRRFLAEHERAVLATGGGIVMSPQSLSLLIERTQTVWLKAQPEEHWARVVEQGDLRPMRNRPHAMAELRRRLREREPLYARARLKVTTTGRSVDEVVGELIAAVGRPVRAG